MEVLNRFLLWTELQMLLPPLNCVENRVSLYSDDLVIFINLATADLHTLKAALAIFGLVSGLFSNLEKSVAIPLNCSADDDTRVHEILSCRRNYHVTTYTSDVSNIWMNNR